MILGDPIRLFLHVQINFRVFRGDGDEDRPLNPKRPDKDRKRSFSINTNGGWLGIFLFHQRRWLCRFFHDDSKCRLTLVTTTRTATADMRRSFLDQAIGLFYFGGTGTKSKLPFAAVATRERLPLYCCIWFPQHREIHICNKILDIIMPTRAYIASRHCLTPSLYLLFPG